MAIGKGNRTAEAGMDVDAVNTEFGPVPEGTADEMDPNAVFGCDFSSAPIIATAPDGDARVSCTNAEWKTSQKGNRYWRLQLKITAPVPMAENTVYGSVFHNIFLPDVNEPDLEKKGRMMQRYKLALQAFGLPTNVGHAPQDLIGCEAKVVLATEEYQGEFRNVVNKLVV